MKFVSIADLLTHIDNPRVFEILRDNAVLKSYVVDFSTKLISEKLPSISGGFVEPGVKLLRDYNVQYNLRLMIALSETIEEYGDASILISTAYNRRLKNTFPEEGLWFIQQKISGDCYCFWHQDKNFKLNIRTTLIAGFGNNSLEYNSKYVRYISKR